MGVTLPSLAAAEFDGWAEAAISGYAAEGLGRAAMLLAEDVLRDAGYETIQLSVFGFNAGAQALYESLGYTVVATTMAKPLTVR